MTDSKHHHGANYNHSHGHHHNYHHSYAHNFNEHHKHGPNCEHKHDNQSHHYTHGEHAPDCDHKHHHHDHSPSKYKELTAIGYAKRRSRRKLRQWSRRGNHTIQNGIAAIWICSLAESSLQYYYENNMYDKILLFHGFQLLSLILFFYASLSEPGFLSPNAIPDDSNAKTKKNGDEVISLLSSIDYTDIENNGIMVDPAKETPPSFCRRYVFYNITSLHLLTTYMIIKLQISAANKS